MSLQLIQQYYTKVEKLIQYGGSKNESAIRSAFQTLLEQYCTDKNLFQPFRQMVIGNFMYQAFELSIPMLSVDFNVGIVWLDQFPQLILIINQQLILSLPLCQRIRLWHQCATWIAHLHLLLWNRAYQPLTPGSPSLIRRGSLFSDWRLLHDSPSLPPTSPLAGWTPEKLEPPFSQVLECWLRSRSAPFILALYSVRFFRRWFLLCRPFSGLRRDWR